METLTKDEQKIIDYLLRNEFAKERDLAALFFEELNRTNAERYVRLLIAAIRTERVLEIEGKRYFIASGNFGHTLKPIESAEVSRWHKRYRAETKSRERVEKAYLNQAFKATLFG